MKNGNDKKFYGNLGRLAKILFKTFSKRYENEIEDSGKATIYICRHLNMHGPYTTLKTFPFDVHPLVYYPFCEEKTCYRQYCDYTFTEKRNKRKRKLYFSAYVASRVVPKTVRSLQSIPVYRGTVESLKTIRKAMEYLLKNESLIVFPDIDYTADKETPSGIYDGFLYLGERYYKKTGKPLRFVPVYIDEDERRIREGEAVFVSDYKDQRETCVEYLQSVINGAMKKMK